MQDIIASSFYFLITCKSIFKNCSDENTLQFHKIIKQGAFANNIFYMCKKQLLSYSEKRKIFITKDVNTITKNELLQEIIRMQKIQLFKSMTRIYIHEDLKKLIFLYVDLKQSYLDLSRKLEFKRCYHIVEQSLKNNKIQSYMSRRELVCWFLNNKYNITLNDLKKIRTKFLVAIHESEMNKAFFIKNVYMSSSINYHMYTIKSKKKWLRHFKYPHKLEKKYNNKHHTFKNIIKWFDENIYEDLSERSSNIQTN